MPWTYPHFKTIRCVTGRSPRTDRTDAGKGHPGWRGGKPVKPPKNQKKREMQSVWRTNETIELITVPPNNHGCRGYWVLIIPLSNIVGIVVDGGSCASCWQRGHDDASPPLRVGTVVALPPTVHSWADAVMDGECHHDGGREPDSTRVGPGDLAVVSERLCGLFEAVEALVGSRRRGGIAAVKRAWRELTK